MPNSMNRNPRVILLLIALSCFYSLFAKESLVILNFDMKNKNPVVEKNAVWIPAQIQDALVRSPYVQILERKKLDEIFNEMKLGQTGFVDQSAVIRIGKLAGAQKLLMGELDSPSSLTMNINARLVDVETGTAERQWTATNKKEKDLKTFIQSVSGDIVQLFKAREALTKISDIKNEKAAFHVKLNSEKTEYVFGEMLSVQITADTNCYVYLFDVGTSGNIHLLFPNRMETDNRVRAGIPIYVGNLKTGPPAGVEVLKAVASLDSISYQNLLDKAAASALFPSVGGNADTFSRDLELLVSPLPTSRWSESFLRLNIKEK